MSTPPTPLHSIISAVASRPYCSLGLFETGSLMIYAFEDIQISICDFLGECFGRCGPGRLGVKLGFTNAGCRCLFVVTVWWNQGCGGLFDASSRRTGAHQRL